MPKCKQCGDFYHFFEGDVCATCTVENEIDTEAIERLIGEGHPSHCAERQVYGDGECECALYSGVKYDPYAWTKIA